MQFSFNARNSSLYIMLFCTIAAFKLSVNFFFPVHLNHVLFFRRHCEVHQRSRLYQIKLCKVLLKAANEWCKNYH